MYAGVVNTRKINEPSVGSVGDSYNNAVATEPFRYQEPLSGARDTGVSLNA